MKCDNHYPIMGNWDVIEETRDYRVWKCPKCGEVYKGNRHKGVLEFTTDAIKEGRRKYRKELLQSHRGGELSKEYVEAYPNQVSAMIKEGVTTKEKVKNCKNVWGNDNV